MKYFIGKVPNEHVETFGSDGLFEYKGEFFYNSVEFGSNPGGTEDFTISDTCGRSIPLSVDIIDVLIGTLVDIRCTLHTLEKADEIQDCLLDSEFIHTFE